MQEFSNWKQRYDRNELSEFNGNLSGLLWLKLKSLARKELFAPFIQAHSLSVSAKTLVGKWEEVFSLLQTQLPHSHEIIYAFMRQAHQARLDQFNEANLVSELYKLKHYDWGGDYKNSLDKYLVDDFIKVYRSFDDLTSKLDKEIARSVTGYVFCSWYNHWSSILIENLFTSHPAVLPAVGQIKKVDFFIGQLPFDLKVTSLPANYIEEKRKQCGLKPELSELKQAARRLGISFQGHRKANDTYYEISQKLIDRNDEASLAALSGIVGERKRILRETVEHHKELIVNLYEKQGEMRFDAANRLFLILVDSNNFDESWKLRRNLDLLKPAINKYLDEFSNRDTKDLQTKFSYGGKEYQCLSDCVFVIR